MIADSGPGIPVAMRTRVFDRFFRLSDAGKSGSGLGLSIVKRIAEAHHATIELADGLDGAGLAVQICFPLCQADQEQLA
jgi:two-component system sensor histidine kinase QseC